MAERVVGISGIVLRWARERAGYSIDEAAEATGRAPDELGAWEAGESAPTYRQLEKLAATYKRPVAVFFFPEPPSEPEVTSEFRTLPESDLERLEPDTRFAIRETRAYQESLRELTGGRNPAERVIAKDIRATLNTNVPTLVSRVREYLGVSLREQQNWSGGEGAFKAWRTTFEGVGVFVFKRSFKQKAISAFCLHDSEFPLIMINNGTSFNRQTFSLFHELAHLLYGVSGVTTEDTSYVARLRGNDRAIEVACNRFAAEFLVPREGFPLEQLRSADDLEEEVARVARTYNVSREVILRRLMDEGAVDNEVYTRLAEQWNEDYRRAVSSTPGGDYYYTKAAYLGDAFLTLAFDQLHSGRVALGDLAEHLQVKAKNIETLESYFRRRK